MHHSFRIHFNTAPGQSVQIVFGDVAVDLQWLGDGWWGGTAPTTHDVKYHYRVLSGGVVATEEAPSIAPIEAAFCSSKIGVQ